MLRAGWRVELYTLAALAFPYLGLSLGIAKVRGIAKGGNSSKVPMDCSASSVRFTNLPSNLNL